MESAPAREYDHKKRHLAAFTVVQDEPFFLPIWIRHYLKQVGGDPIDLYVLDHRHGTSADTVTAAAGANVVPIFRGKSFDHCWLAESVACFFAFLLQSYNYVVFAEVDELILPNPAASVIQSMADLCRKGAALRPWFRAKGYEVIHQRDVEQPLIGTESPLLEHRGWWQQSKMYSKTLVASVRLTWGIGFHEAYHSPQKRVRIDTDPDSSLLLVHLKKVDFQQALIRSRSSASRPWNEQDKSWRAGWQNRITTETDMAAFFTMGDDKAAQKLEPIPGDVRSII